MAEHRTGYINYYVHCGKEWTDEWDCMCNDDCLTCHGEIEPYMSERLDSEGKVIDTIYHVDMATFEPQGGWEP